MRSRPDPLLRSPRPTRRAVPLLLAAALAACAAGPRPAADPEVCAELFERYDTAAHLFQGSFDDENSPPIGGPLSRPSQLLRNNGCLTSSSDLDGLPELAQRLAPYRIAHGGASIRPVPIHLGVVTGIADEARATAFFRGLGYRSRGVGAEGLGRRLYIGPFTDEAALEQALNVAREAGFIAPFVAHRTRF